MRAPDTGRVTATTSRHPSRAGGRDGAGRIGTSVRTRVLTAVLTLSALGLAVAGLTSYALQRERLDDQIDQVLTRNVEEFRNLADDGVDPETGLPFTSVRGLLRLALQRAVPATNEGTLALVDGEVAWTAPTTVRLRVEEDGDLVRRLAALEPSGTTLRSVDSATAHYRVALVPVRVAGDDAEGLFVLAFDRGIEHEALTATYRTYALVAVGALLVTGVIGWLVTGRLLAPVRLLRRTAQRITDSDLSDRIPVRGDDDLSDLARTVNAMLDRLERAFASQRRLLDDAGHELRTPLTIVRGHLELMDAEDPDDVRATRELALDEVDRMQGLVDDLMVLATAERPDFVAPAVTDVAQLTDEVADKARALGGQRWRVTGRAEVDAVVDPRRLTQAMLQLAANAAKFSPPDGEIRIASRVDGDRLELTVSDDGPGIPSADAERVFERFARAGSGRGVEGSGLGLPIVAAIAAAHGGTAHAESPPGGGATLVVRLPLRRPPADGASAPEVADAPTTSPTTPDREDA